MVNDLSVIRDFLLAQAALFALTGERVWWGVNEPPQSEQYQPSQGIGICINRSGGTQDFDNTSVSPRIQFKIYGVSEPAINTAVLTLNDVFHEAHSYEILSSTQDTMAIMLDEPDTLWKYGLVFYRVTVRNTSKA